MTTPFDKPLNKLVSRFIDDHDNLFTKIKNINKNKKLYHDWYISLDGAGGVNCILFTNNNFQNVNCIRKCVYIGDFTCSELSAMKIYYDSWFENNKKLKTHADVIADVIADVYEYIKFTR